MPTQPSNQATQQEQARQQALTATLATAMAAAFLLIDMHDLKGTLPKYEAAVAALVYKYGQASASLTSRYYQAQRAAAGVAGAFRPTPSAPPGIGEVQKNLSWATEGLWSPARPSRQADVPPDAKAAESAAKAEADAVQNARTLTQGAAQKMVVDTGRNTLLEAIEADKECRGWAREARPDACSFCAMLSVRGPVYKEHSFDSSDAKFAGGESEIKVHDHCHCLPVPVFADHYEPPAHVRQWQQIYTDSTRGKSGANARNAFRIALDKSRNPAPQPVSV
jgi:hypothetical protein